MGIVPFSSLNERQNEIETKYEATIGHIIDNQSQWLTPNEISHLKPRLEAARSQLLASLLCSRANFGLLPTRKCFREQE